MSPLATHYVTEITEVTTEQEKSILDDLILESIPEISNRKPSLFSTLKPVSKFSDDHTDFIGYIAWVNCEPVGCVVLTPSCEGKHFSEIKKLYMKEDHRNKGLGSQLILTAIAHAETTADKWLSLFVAETKTMAIHLYQKMGFKEADNTVQGYLRFVFPLKQK